MAAGDQLRRSIAMLCPAQPADLTRERAIRLLEEVQRSDGRTAAMPTSWPGCVAAWGRR
jgi:hypothetical protein